MKRFGTPVPKLSMKERVVPEAERWVISDETLKECKEIEDNIRRGGRL
jgi:hypothetical protein